MRSGNQGAPQGSAQRLRGDLFRLGVAGRSTQLGAAEGRRSSKAGSERGAVVFGVTASGTARAFLRGQLAFLHTKGWEVHLVHGDHAELSDFAELEHARTHRVRMVRNPSPSDPLAFVRTFLRLARIRPRAVVMGTPKMGVVGILAAALLAVPRRVFLVHGLRWEGLEGWLARVTRRLDRLACAAATDVVAVSDSVMRVLIAEGISSPSKTRVLGHGSANGVDTTRFTPTSHDNAARIRSGWGLPAEADVVAFVGRLTRDKGIAALVSVIEEMRQTRSNTWFIVVGNEEPVDDLDRALIRRLSEQDRVLRLPHTDEVERVYQASNVLLMLSKREGLGMVVLEAAACGVPSVALAVTGCVNAIVDGDTGFLCSPDQPQTALARLGELLDNPSLASRMGEQARIFVRNAFGQESVWRAWDRLLVGASPEDA